MKYLALTLPDGTTIEGPPGVPTGGFTDGSAEGNAILGGFLQLFFAIAVILVLFVMLWGGIMWITSRGDKEKLAAARNRIFYAIIGLVVIFLSALIINLILFFFGQPTLGLGPVDGNAVSDCEAIGGVWDGDSCEAPSP